jgi:hypothetical protein
MTEAAKGKRGIFIVRQELKWQPHGRRQRLWKQDMELRSDDEGVKWNSALLSAGSLLKLARYYSKLLRKISTIQANQAESEHEYLYQGHDAHIHISGGAGVRSDY